MIDPQIEMSLNFPPMPRALDIMDSGNYILDDPRVIYLKLPPDAQTVLSIDNSDASSRPVIEFHRAAEPRYSSQQSQPGPNVYSNLRSSGSARQFNGQVNTGSSTMGNYWNNCVAEGNSRQYNGNIHGDVVMGNTYGNVVSSSRHSADNRHHKRSKPHILTIRLPGGKSISSLNVEAAGLDFLSPPTGFTIENLEIATTHAATKYGDVVAIQATMETEGGDVDATRMNSRTWTYKGTSGSFQSQIGPYVHGRATTLHGAANLHVPDDPCFRNLDVDSTHAPVNVSSPSGNKSSIRVKSKYGNVMGDGLHLGKKYTKAATGNR